MTWKNDKYEHGLARKGVRTRMGKNMKAKGMGLMYNNVHAIPREYNFAQGWGEDWELWVPDFYEMDEREIKEYLNHAIGLTQEEMERMDKHELINEATETWYEQEQPMMNYLYPIEGYEPSDDDWKKLNNMSIVYIMEEGEYYLALTGGGMDMSWQICETYINLGYYPPAHFCDLPGMAGKDYNSEKNKRIINACMESLDAVESQTSWKKERLMDLGKE